MPRVSIRVRPTDARGRFLSSKDAAPWADVVGHVGNTFVDRTLDHAEIETLRATGVFEFREPTEAPRNVVRLIGRDDRRDVVKLVCDGGDDGAA